MTNDQRNDNLPVASAASFDVDAIWQRTQDMSDRKVEAFPSFGGSVGLYSNMLHGVPFIFTSDVVFKTQTGGQFGPQEVGQAYVQTFDEHWQLQPAQLVNFTGAYLLGALRNASRNDLVGSYVFTVWPNTKYRTIGGKAPLMIKRYEAGDMPPSDDQSDVWAGGNKPPAPDGAAARVNEIASAGPVPPPWEIQATGPTGSAGSAGSAGPTRRAKP